MAIAEDVGKFTFLGQNQCAPFEGVLFDPQATATILADRTTVGAECEIRLKYALDTQSTEHKLELQNLQIRHDALVSEYDMRVQSLEREADALANALKKQSSQRPVLWATIGFVGGVVFSYTAYRTFNEQ